MWYEKGMRVIGVRKVDDYFSTVGVHGTIQRVYREDDANEGYTCEVKFDKYYELAVMEGDIVPADNFVCCITGEKLKASNALSIDGKFYSKSFVEGLV